MPSIVSGVVAVVGTVSIMKQYSPGSLVGNIHLVQQGFLMLNLVTFADEVTKAGLLLKSQAYDYLFGNTEQKPEQNTDESGANSDILNTWSQTDHITVGGEDL